MSVNFKNTFRERVFRADPKQAHSSLRTRHTEMPRSVNSGSIEMKRDGRAKLRRTLLLESVLINLGLCHEISYRRYADILGVSLNDVLVRYTRPRDPSSCFDFRKGVWSGNDPIEMEVILDSPASEAQLARLNDMVDRYCPGLGELRKLAPMVSSVRLGSLSLVTAGAIAELEGKFRHVH
ncbi:MULTISPECIES: hypothetical protein [unclassified Bradyrhizobium]|nr:hypothetical protein [Bradyrhizobium sp. USDA 4538]MCP1985567.1 putative OsmC-like protein [Bradyrhizobium sp. USDA 4539]